MSSDQASRIVERVRAVRERLIAAGTVLAHADGVSRDLFPVAIGPEEGRALRDWVGNEGAVRTLETGLGFAISTLFIIEGLLANGRSGRHVATDPYQFVGLPMHATTYVGVGLQILEEAGVRDLVEFYPEESLIVLPRLLAEGREFDFAFLDGNHRFEGAFLDLIYSGRLLRRAGSSSSMTRNFQPCNVRSPSAPPTLGGRGKTKAKRAFTSGRCSGPVRTRCSYGRMRSSSASDGH
ncbi:MAG TPA: class I SAM-dependent methyltransferase [Actinomycetota bacterium]|nr:class I SAM-dependent methyltransferase [Actinomycetota bacterium]